MPRRATVARVTLARPRASGVSAEDVFHTPPAWRCRAVPARGGAQIIGEGELDVAVVPALDDVARTVTLAPGEVLRVDLTGVSFIDSSVVAFLLGLHARAAAASARLEIAVPPEGGVLRTLTVCGACGVLNVV